ncbi:META domain-containing protein [Hymenobacter sp. HSC-4F20]|uniref:META domain-containing protein n=1 Tax=Hymenobacter sp. HSC-4F20 TaxID=2864135 RepID=UPI001C735813|nr:META domain-containing protein [Hymenobacter sp. HSC-4F20]MBX0290215.1 META domain-containing protein [Hymenobacter sp. HSC-4F20]
MVPSATTPTPAASAATTASAALRGTHWVLRRLDGQSVTPTSGNEVYLQLSATEQQAEGQAGCNRFRGGFTLPAESQLQFGPLLSTKMACPDLATETAFLAALRTTRSYRISADTLYLHGESTSTALATLQAQRP